MSADGPVFYFGLGMQWLREKTRALQERKIVLSNHSELVGEAEQMRVKINFSIHSPKSAEVIVK